MVWPMLHFFDQFEPLPGRAGPYAGQLVGGVGEELWAGPVQESIVLVKNLSHAYIQLVREAVKNVLAEFVR